MLLADPEAQRALIVRATELVREAARVGRCGLNEVQSGIEEGRSLSKSFALNENLFPLTFTSLIQVGENSGQLSKMLGSINDYYGAEFDDSVTQFTALLEPIMIVFMGIVIGGVLLAMYMPMFTMGEAL